MGLVAGWLSVCAVSYRAVQASMPDEGEAKAQELGEANDLDDRWSAVLPVTHLCPIDLS